jgi:tetratricopeptide (TPR) repeat protein
MPKKRMSEGVTSKDPASSRWRTKFSAARMAYETGEFRKAETLLARCLEIAKDLPERQFALSSTDVAIGAVQLAAGRVREADTRLQRAITLLEGDPDPLMQELLAVTLRFHSQVLVESGDERAAESELKTSAEILRKVGREAVVQLAYTLSDLCGLYATQGRYSEAEQNIVQAMKIVGAELGPQSPEYVRTDMIYEFLTPMSADSRLDFVSEGIQKMQYTHGGKHPNVNRALHRYFTALEKRGDEGRIAEAQKQFGLSKITGILVLTCLLVGAASFAFSSGARDSLLRSRDQVADQKYQLEKAYNDLDRKIDELQNQKANVGRYLTDADKTLRELDRAISAQDAAYRGR